MTNTTLDNIASSLAFDAKIDFDSAKRVINWLVTEGVLDGEVVNETYNEEAKNATA